MAKTILITGGAGFIGSHLADELLVAGHRVRVLDNLSAQVHHTGAAPRHLSPHVELIRGDVRDREAVKAALQGVDQVAHLAAAVGAVQSMYQVEAYVDTNHRGMAVLLEALIERPVERLLVASCMSTYGEGLYLDVTGAPVAPRERSLEQLRRGDWEVRDEAGRPLSPLPTPETKPAEKVEEPTEAQAIVMMRGVTPSLEKHHNVRILDEAVEASVRLSHRYISGRQLPDKCVSVLDTACARLALSQSATPSQIEDCQRRIAQLTAQIEALVREEATGGGHAERIAELSAARVRAEEELRQLQERWEKERDLVARIREIRDRLEAHALKPEGDGALKPEELEKLRAELAALGQELKALQGETPLMQVCVDAQTVADVISGWTGIPVGKMMSDEINTVLTLHERLAERVIGQDHALMAISQRIRTARANLVDPRRPIGVFLLVGPSGVGKTETGLALADALYGGERNMVTINMSEYQEAHTVSSLKGSPPGYVGYGEGGVLTEAVRRKPYCVVLLDEVEKAHPDVMELFFQVFDKGQLEDGEGREIDFKHTVILLTSNAGTETIMKLCADPETRPDYLALAEALRPDLLKFFKPAFLGRLIVVPYFPITDDVMRQIIRLQLGRIQKRMAENHRAEMTYGDELVEEIAGRCKEVESGARNVDHILTRTLLPEISQEILARMAKGETISRVHVGVGPGGAFQYDIS